MLSDKRSLTYVILTLCTIIILGILYITEINKSISPNEAMQALINGKDIPFNENVDESDVEELRDVLGSADISNIERSIEIVSGKGTYIVSFNNPSNRTLEIVSIIKEE